MGVIADEVFDLSAEHHEFAYRFGVDGLVVAEETLAVGCLEWESFWADNPESIKRRYLMC